MATKTVDLQSYLRQKGSPYADYTSDLIKAANKYRVDPRLIVAISGGETSFGKTGNATRSYNAWGIGPGVRYQSWADGFDGVAKLLRTGYLNKGLTSLQAIQRKWAPLGAGNDPKNLNSNWLRVNGQFYADLGGNPGVINTGWRNQSSPVKAQEVTTTGVPTDSQLISLEEVSMQNLQDIAAGKKSSEIWNRMLQTAIHNTEVRAQATRDLTQPPEASPNRSPDGGSYTPIRTGESADMPAKNTAVQIALQQIGKPYVWGADSPSKGFDCSGLIEYAYEQAGIPTPGRLTTYSAMKLGHSVKGGAIQPGDWIISNGGKHMVMYVGGGQVVAAPHTGTNVQLQPLSKFGKSIVDIRRYP